MKPPESHTVSEQLIAVIAREVSDGDVLLEGIGTFLPTAAYMLAQATHAKRAVRLCPVGNVFVAEPHRLTLAGYEFDTLRRGISRFDYWDVNGSHLPAFLPGRKQAWKEFLRPAQVDANGRTNNIVIGPYEAPRVRLPGAAGLPDGIPSEPALYMYVPRHDRDTFVQKLDFVSAPGLGDGGRPYMVVTNLAVMKFVNGALQVQTLLPGVTREEVQDNTGFEVCFSPHLIPFEPLTDADLALLRNVIDPDSLRDVELLAGEKRLRYLQLRAGAEDTRHSLRAALRDCIARAA